MPTQPNRRIVFNSGVKLAVVRKRFDANGVEAADGVDEQIVLSGRPMVWNALSDDRGGYKVRLLPNSAQFVTPTHALFHHDYRAVLGATNNNSLVVTPDEIGVSVDIRLPDTQTARDVATLVEDEYVRGMSFSMLLDDVFQAEEVTEGTQKILQVSAFTCDEVTITAIPSFADTSISIKADDQSIVPPQQMSKAPERIAQALKLEQFRLAATRL